MTSILILKLIISCLIRGFLAGLVVMMNPYEQRLAFRLWFMGYLPHVSAAISSTTILYWVWCTKLSGDCDINLGPQCVGLTLEDDLPTSSRSLGFRLDCYWFSKSQVIRRSGPLQSDRCLVSPPRHHVSSRSSPGQTPYNNCPPVSWSLLVAARLWFSLNWWPVCP